jgi:hypothetical protein
MMTLLPQVALTLPADNIVIMLEPAASSEDWPKDYSMSGDDDGRP